MFRCAATCVLLLCTAACVRVEAYTCMSDGECASRPGGVCEPTNYCSYTDDTCESQQRYSSLAGPLAGQCTDVVVGTTGTDSTTTDPSTSTLTTSSSSSDNSEGPVRMTETDVDPPMSGDVLWSFTYAGSGEQADVFRAVVAIDDTDFIVAGHESVPVTGRDVLLARYGGPDDERWIRTRDTDGATDHANAMVRGSDGGIFLAGQETFEAEIRPWVGRWETDGDFDWATELVGTTAHGVAYGNEGVLAIVGAAGSMAAFVTGRWSYNLPIWDHPLPNPPATQLLAVSARGSEFFVGGEIDGVAYLARADATGVVPLATLTSARHPTSQLQAVVATRAAIFAVGWGETLDVARQGLVARLDLDGMVAWQHSPGDSVLNDECEGVAIGGAGQIYVVGYSAGAEDFDVWVSEWTPDGDEVWSRTYPELDEGKGIARGIAVLPGGDLLVVGEVEGPGGDQDAFVARLLP